MNKKHFVKKSEIGIPEEQIRLKLEYYC